MQLENEARPSAGSGTETTAVLTHTLDSAGDRSRTVEPLYGARLGRFILAEFLGEGTSGRVYVAHDTILDRAVPIKRLQASASDAHLVQERLLGEAPAMQALQGATRARADRQENDNAGCATGRPIYVEGVRHAYARGFHWPRDGGR